MNITPGHRLIHDVEAAACAVADGAALTGAQLDRLRDAAARLRRAIEARALSGPGLCRWCAEPYAEHESCAGYCSVVCQQHARRERARDLERS